MDLERYNRDGLVLETSKDPSSFLVSKNKEVLNRMRFEDQRRREKDRYEECHDSTHSSLIIYHVYKKVYRRRVEGTSIVYLPLRLKVDSDYIL